MYKRQVQVGISCSVGVTIFPQDGDDTHVLLHNADLAMYQAKAAGRSRCHFYSADSEHAQHRSAATAD